LPTNEALVLNKNFINTKKGIIMSILIIFLWVILSIIVGFVATQKNRSFPGFFFLSLIFSPILSLLVLIVLPVPLVILHNSSQNKIQKCPSCAETIQFKAVKCKCCGSEIKKLPDEKLAHDQENMVTISCPSCNLEDSTPYPMNAKYYNNFDAKEQIFSPTLNLSCKECGCKFIYDW